MCNELSDTVVAYTKTKQAALYFPHVVAIPSILIGDSIIEAFNGYLIGVDLQTTLQSIQSLVENELGDTEGSWVRLLPPELGNDAKFFRLLKKVTLWDALNSTFYTMLDSIEPSSGFETKKSELVKAVKTQLGVNLFHEQSRAAAYQTLISRYELGHLPTVVPDAWTLMDADVPTDAGIVDFRLTLVDVDLIDTTTASWDKIIAFRQDKESQKKLHRLRRFFLKNYSGKSASFIRDDLHDRLEDHEFVVRKFGFEKRSTILEAVVSSKWLQGSLAGAGLAACFGNNSAAWVSGLTAVLFEVGNTAVKIRRKKFEFKELIAQHPLGYIITANESIGKSA